MLWEMAPCHIRVTRDLNDHPDPPCTVMLQTCTDATPQKRHGSRGTQRFNGSRVYAV